MDKRFELLYNKTQEFVVEEKSVTIDDVKSYISIECRMPAPTDDEIKIVFGMLLAENRVVIQTKPARSGRYITGIKLPD